MLRRYAEKRKLLRGFKRKFRILSLKRSPEFSLFRTNNGQKINMSTKERGNFFRKGPGLAEVVEAFGDQNFLKEWLTERNWPQDTACPHCGLYSASHWIRRWRQNRCCHGLGKPMKSVGIETTIEGSNLKHRIWDIRFYLLTTTSKGFPR